MFYDFAHAVRYAVDAAIENKATPRINTDQVAIHIRSLPGTRAGISPCALAVNTVELRTQMVFLTTYWLYLTIAR
jgi:hypothetical protein